MLARIRSLTAALVRRGRLEDDMEAEFREHLENYAEDLIRAGTPPEEARRLARIEFGSLERVKEECRQSRGLRAFDELRQDLRYAFRTFRRTPALTAAAVLSLALAIGANTAIFSLIDAVLLRMLPVRDPQQLYFLGRGPKDAGTGGTYALYELYRENLGGPFSAITAVDGSGFKVRSGESTELTPGLWASGNFHAVLGLNPAAGRLFTSESDRPAGSAPYAVISYDYWTRRFQRDPGAIGKTLIINDRPITIAGVTPAGFYGISPGYRADITLPLSMKPIFSGQADEFDRRDSWTSLKILARLRPGVPEPRARAAVDVLFQRYVSDPACRWLREMDAEQYRYAELLPASKGLSDLRKRYSKPLLALMAMVGVVLLIACANIANLLLARAGARAREIAVRLSIGAGRGRLARQFLTESLVLAATGGVLGAVLAYWLTGGIASFFNTGLYPIRLDARPDLRMLGFTAALSLLAGVLFGMAPAIHAVRADLTPNLKGNGAATGGGRFRPGIPRILVALQIALCLLLVTGAVLLTRTLRNLNGLDAGFERGRLLLADVDASGNMIPPAQRAQFYPELLSRITALPGVRSASYSDLSPIGTGMNMRSFVVRTGIAPRGERMVWANVVSPSYFETVGIHLSRGRLFDSRDTADRPKVAVVNESLARHYFGAADPIGQRFYFGKEAKGDGTEIVGVVRDNRQRNLREVPPRMVYTPYAQARAAAKWATVEVRCMGDPRALSSALRETVRAFNNQAVITYLRTMDEQIDVSLLQERLLAALSAAFGVLALVLACVGVYGVMAFAVARRTREIGIRMALGAQPCGVLWSVVRECLILVAAGLIAGLSGVFAASRFVSSFLYGLEPNDPATIVTAGAILAAAGIGACLLPATRAARTDPIAVLRYE